jgi:hypothetical protein
VTLTLIGSRLDTYRGSPFPQASAVASVSGLGDVIVRAKYNLWRSGGSGLAIGGDARLPTGEADNFLGEGKTVLIPRIIASLEEGRIAFHGDIGYARGGISNEVDYGGAATVAASRRVTIVGEVVGRRLASSGDLVYVTTPQPGVVGVNTIRLTGTDRSTSQVSVVAGLRWNIGGRWLLSANVLRPVTSGGLNARWVPTMTLDDSFGR